MKRNTFFVLSLVAASLFATETASARGVIVYSTGPQFETNMTLPDEVIIDGKHVNFGVAYEQFSIFWVPIWNYGDIEYALIDDDGDTAWPVDEDILAELQSDYGVEISGPPTISFWNKFGGKLIWGALILFLLWYYNIRKKKGEEASEEES